MAAAYPAKMRALFLVERISSFDQPNLAACFEVREVDTPTPKYGEVLVKVECSPINPSNLSILKGEYSDSAKNALPSLIGTEGSGTVVASGGVWAEYVAVNEFNCVTLPDDISFEGGSSCFVNPLTVVAFVEIAIERRVKAIVHTAGASALGKMLIKHAKEYDIEVIAVVRRADQAKSLQAIGAKYIVDTSVAEWKAELKTLASDLGATLGFDAVAGSLTGDILESMPNGSEVQVYGGLSNQASNGLSPRGLIFEKKKVSGFWLVEYMKVRGTLGVLSMVRKVSNGLEETFSTTISRGYALENAAQAIQDYTKNMSDNKVAFIPPQTA
ncbi:hypothetical protein Ae201684P_022383 [Aphanomyces euteiches]|nr:hypothetical protein Ae201684P_022383 [Aphanomyces euteiches]